MSRMKRVLVLVRPPGEESQLVEAVSLKACAQVSLLLRLEGEPEGSWPGTESITKCRKEKNKTTKIASSIERERELFRC